MKPGVEQIYFEYEAGKSTAISITKVHVTCGGCGRRTELDAHVKEEISSALQVQRYRLVPSLGWLCPKCWHAVPVFPIQVET